LRCWGTACFIQPTYIILTRNHCMLSERFRTLPIELVELIFEHAALSWHIESPHATANLLTITPWSHVYCIARLYTAVTLDHSSSARLFARTLALGCQSAHATRHLRALSVSLSADEKWTEVDALIPLAPYIGTLPYAQAPLDILAKAQATPAWHAYTATHGKRCLSILSPTAYSYVHPGSVVRLALDSTRLHIGGVPALFHALAGLDRYIHDHPETYHPAGLLRDGNVPTHIAVDCLAAHEWKPSYVERTLRKLLEFSAVQRVVFRVPTAQNEFAPLVSMLRDVEDSRVCVSVVRLALPEGGNKSAVEGWRNHMSGEEDIWLSGEPVVPRPPIVRESSAPSEPLH
jgi:hypothetical protein